MRRNSKVFFIAATLCFSSFSNAQNADCFTKAEGYYSLPGGILRAIAEVESGFNPKATNKNTNGSIDMGMMQINSIHLDRLKKFGIEKNALFDACQNIYVGAYILRENINRLGWNWNAIGAYNAASPDKRAKYANKVIAAYNRNLRRSGSVASSSNKPTYGAWEGG